MSPGETLYPKELPQPFAPLAFLRKVTFESYCIAWEAHERPGFSPCSDTFESYCIAWETHERPGLSPCSDSENLCSRGKCLVSSGPLLPPVNAEIRHEHL